MDQKLKLNILLWSLNIGYIRSTAGHGIGSSNQAPETLGPRPTWVRAVHLSKSNKVIRSVPTEVGGSSVQVGRDPQYRHRWDALPQGGRQVGWASQDLWSCPQQGMWTGHTCPGSQERQPDLRTFGIATAENWPLFFLLSVLLIIFLKSRHKLINFKINPTNLQNWHRSSSWSVMTLDSKFPRTSSSLPAAHTSSPSRMVSLSHLSNGPWLKRERNPWDWHGSLASGAQDRQVPQTWETPAASGNSVPEEQRQIAAQILAQGNNTGSQWIKPGHKREA